MKALLYYLVQVIVTSGILYAYYHFALRNNKFHRYNRFYLLTATVISITIPFLNIPVYFTQKETNSSFVLQTLTVISSSDADAPVLSVAHLPQNINWFTWQNLSYCSYILISAIILLSIIISIFKIRRIVKNNPVEQLDNIHFVNTGEPGTPFSFFRWLFWNRKIELRSEKGEQIFRHELFHINQKHSWDIMYMELLTVVFWINPFFHLMKKEVKAIHEFLADQFAITENTKWQYAELLLMQAMNTNLRLVNPFFHNQIKRRIAMITASKKPSYQYLRKLMVFPVAAIVIGLFAFSYKQKSYLESFSGNSVSLGKILITDTTRPVAIENNKIFDKAEIDPSFPGGDAKWRQYLERNLDVSVPVKKKAPDGVYSVIVQFVVDKEGNISDVKALTNHGYGMEDEALRVIKTGPKWKPAMVNGQYVKVYRKQPITFVVGKGQKGFRTVDNISRNELAEIVITELVSQNSNNKIFDKAETPPSFPGGDSAWRQFLIKNIRATTPADSGAPAGIYKVIVQFIVNEDGSISEIKANTNHGYGMENEAMRIIRIGPKWIPAKQNGLIVNSYVQQPVTFSVSEEITTDENLPTIHRISVEKLKMVSIYQLLQVKGQVEIISFQITINDEEGNVHIATNSGNLFNPPIVKLIRSAKAGRILTIEIIKVKEKGIEKNIPPRIYHV
ncbi:MAG TPA: energy transducer TonB, partial [Chitinophagaceae bacterium]|nr:energy transducer TonB [Chitinophagaceae bacterium]